MNPTLNQTLYMLNVYQKKEYAYWNPFWFSKYFKKPDVESLFTYLDQHGFKMISLITNQAFEEKGHHPYKRTTLKDHWNRHQYPLTHLNETQIKKFILSQTKSFTKRYFVLEIQKHNSQETQYLFVNHNPTNICTFGFNLYTHSEMLK